VLALVVLYGFPQVIGIEVVLDDTLATPSRWAPGQVDLAVAIVVEQAGNRRGFELADIVDA
jgi:hypothetical protein